MKENRPKAETSTVDGKEKTRDYTEFMDAIPDEAPEEEEDDEDEDEADGNFSPSLYRLAHAKCVFMKRKDVHMYPSSLMCLYRKQHNFHFRSF